MEVAWFLSQFSLATTEYQNKTKIKIFSISFQARWRLSLYSFIICFTSNSKWKFLSMPQAECCSHQNNRQVNEAEMMRNFLQMRRKRQINSICVMILNSWVMEGFAEHQPLRFDLETLKSWVLRDLGSKSKSMIVFTKC